MAKGTPKTREGFNATLQKVPRVRQAPDYNQNPSWRFGLLEMCDPYGWHEISRDKLIEVHQKLREFEKLTWNDILVTNADKHHAVAKHRICQPALDRLNAINQEDIDHLISLRLTGRERIWGILEVGTLRLIWWDPEHDICPSVKKHT